ncbi:hypothetical protein [uncultured Fibrobacter sp.]|uniref:hypothetical protein n=1 Tax=uncultured Fibrobacter sp. TaxID=261512 RepID=UPI002623591E|nr:hypothetical protein [uncultured Fibrobacter sp.]
MNDRFWAKVLFKEFIRHYRKLDDAQIVADVRKSMDDLEDLVDDADSFGSKMVRWSMERVDQYPQARENGKKGGRPKKNPQDAPNGNAGVDMSDAGNGAASKSPTSCDQFTADGDIREDSQAKPDGSAITRNETRAIDALGPSANIYGDAATHEGAEAFYRRESGASAPTTVSRNMRRVPQNEAPAHGFSGGRTAQGTMSRSPEAAAQSGKAYDQETDQVSTNEARQGQALESRRTGGSSVRGMAKVAQPSVRSRASFRNKEDFIQWAIDDGLDPVDAGECWEATEERGGKDADGNTVKNMKAFARQWCRTRANNRRTA